MGYETNRIVHINKKNKYEEKFIQIESATLGIAAGKLSKVGLRLYLYLLDNKNDFNFVLSPLAYAKWYGVESDAEGIDKSKRAGVNKAIRDGIEDLKAFGYIEETGQNSFEFYENGKQIVSSSTAERLESPQDNEKQIVSSATAWDF